MTDNIFDPTIYQIHDLYFKGKANTELMLILVPLFLVALVVFGTFVKSKKQAVAVLLPFLILTQTTYAICPVCTIAVGAGLGFARVYGIDDLITSIWMGGLIVSSTSWMLNWLAKRKISSRKVTLITYVLMYILVIIPLIISGIIGVKGNFVFGIDKVLLGIVIGSLLFYGGMLVNDYLRKTHVDKSYFAFQKVVCPITGLWIGSLISYFIIYYYL